jgi:hypothetical protein
MMKKKDDKEKKNCDTLHPSVIFSEEEQGNCAGACV